MVTASEIELNYYLQNYSSDINIKILTPEWNLLGMNDEGQFFKTESPVVIWPEVVAYQKSFEGDLKRILFNEWQLYNLSVSPVKGFRGDKLARLRGIIGLFQGKKIIFNKYIKR